MGRQLTSVIFAVVFTFLVLLPRPARAEPMREFVMSCSYGVLAGTLVGAATLAFTDRPGDNLNKIARGASLGLYAGMLLGAYVIYGVPDEDAPEEDPAALGVSQLGAQGEVFWRMSAPRPQVREMRKDRAKMAVIPLVSPNGLDGAAVQVSILSF
ncbi:MAG: hypothetical protein NDI61_11970 [Bdellovibrionaceae bacterium]|nr:hypothetical protein [Pseudobdellovibrionaceae bacterium]